MSSDHSNCLGYIGVRAACTLQSAANKWNRTLLLSAHYHADWTDRMEICRLLSLVACAIRVGGALKMTKWWLMIYFANSRVQRLVKLLRNSIGKCCAKLDWSTTLLAALPCRLDISRDNFEGSSYIVSVPRLVQQKIETEHCFFLLLTMQNELIQWNFAKFWRIVGLLACAFRLGRTIRDDKEMTYWILRLHWGVWKETGEWWLCRFAVC